MMVLKGQYRKHCCTAGEQKKLAKSNEAVPRYLARRGYSNFCGRKEVTKNVMGQQTLRHLIYDQFLLALTHC